MGKFRKGKILVIAILMMIVSFFAFTGKADAYWNIKNVNSSSEYCDNGPRIHLIVNGEEMEKQDVIYDSNGKLTHVDVVSGQAFSTDNLCQTYYLPDSNTVTGRDVNGVYHYGVKTPIWDLNGYGIINWYDNPEFEGDPITAYVKLDTSIDHTNEDVYYYAKLGKIISIYVNGIEKKVVVGKEYSPDYLDDEYSVLHGDYSEPSFFGFTTFVNEKGEQRIVYNSKEKFFDKTRSGLHFFRNETQYQNISGIKLREGTKVYVENPDTIPLTDYTKLKERKSYSDSGNSVGMYAPVIDVLTGEHVKPKYSIELEPISLINEVPQYYEYLGFIDQNGNEYPTVFEVKESDEGKHLTTLVDSQMTCTNVNITYPPYAGISTYYYNNNYDDPGGYDKLVYKTGIKLLSDFDDRYMAKGIETREGYIRQYMSSCLPYDVYTRVEVHVDDSLLPNYMIVLNGTEVSQVKRNTIYTLPNEAEGKPAEAFNVTLDYQDGSTPNNTLSYTKVYTPTGFIIDGVHYDFGEKIIVTSNLYIETDYDIDIIGPDLPTPTRDKYTFKGWFDVKYGGHRIDKIEEEKYKTLYAQWVDKDYVVVIRPDGIAVELEKGSYYTMPDIPHKDDDKISTVAFIYNDDTEKIDYSYVLKSYSKNEITCKETGQHYYVGQGIVVNENMTLLGDYNETIKPAKFPSDPEREGYDFLGWFDAIEDGNQYTEYSEDRDLTLYAHWDGDDTVTITYPNGAAIRGDGPTKLLPEGYSKTIEKGSKHKLYDYPYSQTQQSADIYFYFSDGITKTYKTITRKYSTTNGWYVDGKVYAARQIITADKDLSITVSEVHTYQPATFPKVPDRPGYKFLGWYDFNGNKHETFDFDDALKYNGALYAKWQKVQEEYTLPEITAKNPETIATVTLKFQDGISKDKKKYVKKNYVAVDYTVNGGEYNNEHFNVGDTINLTNDVTITPNYEEQIVEVELYSATRDGYMFTGWYDEEEGGTRYYNYSGTEDITLYAQWTTEPIANVCRRATTLHKSGNKTYGNLGTPGSLVPGDAFDCDVNGDGIYDPETERFYYINDLWDAENDTFVESVASLVYYADYYNGPLSSSSKDGFVKYSNTVPNDGPNVAATILPTTDEWSNVSLYKTVRQLSWPANGKTNSNGDLGTYDYSGYAARMISGMELFQSGCLYSYNNKIMAAYYNLNNSCEFLTENIRRTPDGRAEDAYWIESPGGYCPNGYCPADRAYPDFNKYAWALIKKSSNEYSSYMYQSQIEWSRGVRPVIDVPKTSMEDVPEHTIYHTITYPEGQEQVSLHGSTFVFGDVMSGPETEKLASVKFYAEPGIMYEEFVERTTIPTAYKIGNTRYDKGSELLVLDDYQLEYIYVETLKPVEFPDDPTRSGYIFKGWYDAESGGNKYTSYSEAKDLTLYARWENEDTSLTHTVTYPNGDTEKVEHGTKWTFPKNKSTKEDEEGAIVTFDYQNGDENTTARVTKQYIASGWTIDNVHYDDGKRITVNEDITLAYDYVVTYVSPEFPTEMTRDGYTFSSWFDAPAGGTRYESYAGENNITLYAHWNPVGGGEPEPLPDNILCKRATTLHTKECTPIEDYPEGNQPFCSFEYWGYTEEGNKGTNVVTYGNLGGAGEFVSGDAFDCDVNGDGIFDDETERFYYVSDYYDTHTKSFDEDYAALIYSHNVSNGEIALHISTKYNDKATTGTTVNGPSVIYTNLPTTSSWSNSELKDTTRQILTKKGETQVVSDNVTYTLEDFDYQDRAARLLTAPEIVSACPGLRVWTGSTGQKGLDGTFPLSCLYLLENTQFDTAYYNGNADGYFYGYFLETLDHLYGNNTMYTIMLNPNKSNVLFPNWANTTMSGYGSTRPVIDVPKSRMEAGSINYHSITYPDGFVEIVPHGTEIVLPSIPDDMIINATVTFKPENGESDIVRTVNKSKIYNGLLIDNELYEARTSYTVNKDIVITIDYEETDIPVEFPEDPTKEGYTFLGWYTAKVGGDKYTEYNGNEDLTLYAQYSKNDYVLPKNDIPKDSEVNSTVTFKYHNGNPDTTANVIKYYKQHGWLVDGVKHPNGDILENAEGVVIEPNYDTFYMNVEFPENPTKEGYQFIGWYTEETGGELVTVYNGSEDITLHAHYSNKNSYLLNGTEFYNKVSALSNNTRAKDFRKATSEEYETVKNTLGSDNIVSIVGSPYETFAWLDGNTFLYYSEADTIFAHEYCDGMFYSTLFDNVDVSGINFINTTSMNSMFANVMGSKNLTGFNTSKVTSMRDMFAYNRVAPDLSSFDTSHVTNMREMFFCTYYSNIDVSNFDTHNVTNMDRMFAGNGNNAHSHFVTLDLRNFDTGNVTTVNHMFYHTRNLQTLHIENFDTHNVKDFTAFVSWSDVLTSVDVTNFDTSNATTMAEMFRRLYSVTELDLSSFDTSKVTSTRIMFEVSNNLETIYVSRGWDVSNANGYQMFKDDIKLVGQRGTTFDSNHIDNKYAVVDLAPERPGYLTFKGYYIITYPDGTKIEVEPGSVFTFPTNNDSKDSVRKATVTFKYNDGVTPDYESYVGLDYINDGWKVGNKYYQDGEEIVVNSDLTLEYNNVETATGARFPEDPTRDGYTFKGWYDSLAGGDKYTSYEENKDITLYARWERNECTNPEEYTLGTNDISKADEVIGTVTFKYHNGNADTTSNVVKHYTPNGWLVDGEFYKDGETITKCDGAVIEPHYVESIINARFPSNPTKDNLKFTGWYTEETGGESVGVLNKVGDTIVHAQYTGDYAIMTIGEDASGIIAQVIPRTYTKNDIIFRRGTTEEYNEAVRNGVNIVDISSYAGDSPVPVYIFRIDNKVLYYSSASTIFTTPSGSNMFGYVYQTPNSSESTYMCKMFEEVDMSGLNTIYLEKASEMFLGLNNAKTITLGENFVTYNVYNMRSMFDSCSSLTSLDLSNFDTSKVGTTDKDGNSDGSLSDMFYYDESLTELDLTSFNTENVKSMAKMFYKCSSLTELDLSSFDTRNIHNGEENYYLDGIHNMFAEATNLETIYVSDKWDVSNTSSSNVVFEKNNKLVGQNGTAYSNSHKGKDYAIIDNAPENPGYLTLKGGTKTIKYTITYPDGSTEVVPAGTEFKFPSNVPEKDSENIATVTFKPENDTEDIIRYVTKAYINPGWKIEDTHYDIGDIYVVNSDITLAYDYVETIEGVRFPSNPTKEGYVFDGWYNGNTKYTSYSNEEDITLTARWKIEIPTSGEYVLPENNTSKEDEAISTILFKYHNGNPDTVTNVVRRFVPNGWLVNGVHKDAGEIINITKNTVIEPDYNIQIVNGEFPGNAGKTGYKFMGWYTEETGGEKVTVLDSLTDITLHAQYTNDYAILEGGSNFKRELTNMLTDYTYSEPGLTFRKATPEELAESASYNNRKDMKSNTSPNPVYMWFTGTEVLYGSPASIIFLDTFGDEMFQITFDNPMASKFGTIDVSGLNTTNTATMRSMFGNNGNLKRIIFGDFDTGNSWSLSYMFNGDVSLESLDVSGFDTRNATTILGMFKGVQVTELDVDQFDLRKANDIRDLFNGASKLESIDVSNWDTSNIQFISGVFKGCSSITELDVSNWNTSNVKLTDSAFANMPLLTELDLSSWDTSNVYQTNSMFAGDTNLKTIYVSDKWTTNKAVNDSYNTNLFKDDVSIVGQEGTTYDSNNVGIAYAHVDEGPSNPGYLTYKGPKRYKVTYPDGTSDSAVVGTTYTFRTNDSTKEDEDIAVVTFKPSNGEEDITVNVTKSYTANGWKHNSSHINSGHSMKVEEDMVLTYDYTETINNITFPTDPVKEDYTFVGWFDSRTGGTMYTSYNGENDLTLYARYSTDKPEPGSLYNLGVNNTSKADTTSTVIFKYNDEDQTPDTTMVISKQYVPNGWLVDGDHYDDNANVTYVDGMVIEPDYVQTITSGTWPSDPTRYGYEFKGWFDSLSGGKKYTIDDIEGDITLYAHWFGNSVIPIDGILCYRATKLEDDGYYTLGNLGTEGELNSGDAYICDVNGDGIYNAENERFFYVSDYYDTSTKEFNNTYAALIYSKLWDESQDYGEDNYPYDINYEGPSVGYIELPTTTEWSNVSLYKGQRAIITVDGNPTITVDGTVRTLPTNFAYTNRAARFLTIQEFNEGCGTNYNSSKDEEYFDSCGYMIGYMQEEPQGPGDSTHYKSFWLENPIDNSNFVAVVDPGRVGTSHYTWADIIGTKPVIDVPKDVIDLRVAPTPYTIYYPNGDKESVAAGTVFNVPSHNSKKNSVNGAKVTFKPENGGSDIIGYVTKKYVPNGFKIANDSWSTGTHYDIGSTITVNSDLYLKYDWSEELQSVEYPEDIIKAGYELDDWYTEANGQGEKVSSYKGTSNITLYANWTKKTSGKYTLPENTIGRNPEDVATVTFVYGNGKANTTSKVVATYTPNGWLVDGVHKDAGEVINMTPDIVLEPDYIRTVSPAAFPANPTRTNFVFKGWVDNENYNSTDDYNYYTTYDGGEDLTLYAKWETDEDHCSITYSDGEVKVVTCGTNITVPNEVNTESETITFNYMTYWYDDMMDYTDKYETSFDRTFYTKANVENYKIGDNTYNVGESFTVNDDIYVERNLGNPIYDNTPFSAPDEAYKFVAWFTDWNDGVQVKSYYDYKSKGLTTHNLYGHYNDYESWDDPIYSVVVDGVEVGTFTEGTSYTAPAGTDVDEDLAIVTLINGETTNTYKVHKTGTFNNYKVELGDSDGNTSEDGTLDAGSSITVNSNIFLTSQYNSEIITGVDLPVLESNEYTTFKGWYKNENGSGPKYSGTYTDPIDITLYAYFDGKSATVYYYADETENAELIYTGNYKYGDTVDTSNMAVGATVNGKGKLHIVYQNGTTDNDMIIPLEVTKQVDHWKDVDSKTYNKVYVVDFIGTKALTPVFGEGSVISYTLPDPDSDIYPGYTFTGWYTEPQGGTRVTKITEDKDTTVYAHWTRNNDPICVFDNGRTEECNPGDTKTVPQRDSKVVSRIYEIANGSGNYRDYIYNIIPVYANLNVAYYEIDGTKYYPGDTYTIENNTTNIKPYYSSSTIEPHRPDSSVEEEIIEEWFNNDGVARVFTGWYTERTGGDLVSSYDEAEDLYVYAHYEENTPDKEFYNVTYIDITNGSTTYSMLKGTQIKLQNEEIHQTASYYLDPDNGEEKMVGYIHAWALIDYEVNGTKYHADDIVTVNSDLTIKSVVGATNAERMPKDVPNPVKEGYVFTGWYINDNLYDMNDNSLENIAMIAQQTLVAHYEEYNPTTDVIVDFDGDIRIVPKGTTEILPIKSTDWDYIEITFDSLRDYDDYVGIDVAKDLRDYTVNGESIAPGTEVTYMVDTVVRSNYDVTYEYDWDYGITYPELYDWSDHYSDFRGWSDAPNGGNIVEDASNIKEDTTLYAVYAPRYNLTVDGVTTQVPEGYIYTVPNGSTNGDSISFTLDYNYPDHDSVTKEVTIASGKGINYQLINGDRYDVSETYIVMGDTVVESVTNNTDTITMIPEISEPSYEGYLFVGWTDPDRNVPVDIYSLTPEDKYYDGKTLQAYWQKEQDTEENVTIRLIDEYTKTNMQTQVSKGSTYPAGALVNSLTLENTFNSVISNNINSDTIQMTVTTSANVSHFLYNGVRYEKTSDITFNEDGTLEVIRDINTTITCDDSECPEIIYQKPNTKYNEYLFNGIFDNDDNLVDISKLEAQGSPYDDRYSNLTIKLTGLEDSIILTVDNEVSIIPKGMGNIPDAKTKASDVYKVTYDYNDGTNRKVSDNIVTRYTFEHYYVVGKGEFEAGTAYNYLENTTMNSVFSKETIYPEMRTIKTENFLGWFTEPHGGEEVTSLEGIDRDITLFARYNNDHVNIYIDNVANPVLYGEEFTLPAGIEKSDKSITFTLDYNYDNRTEDYTISTSFEFTGYEMDGNNYEPGYTFEATEDKYVTSKYNLTNTFTPEYTEPEREGYIFNGWFNGTEKVNVSELTAENAEINGKTLTASWTEVTPDDVVVTYDGEQRVVPIGTKLSELGDSPIKPSNETFTVYIDRNNGTFIIDTYEITKSYSLDKVYINGEELNENDYTFNEDTTVTTSYTASYEPNIFEGLTSDISGIFTEAVGGVKVENYDNVNDGDTLYYQYGETHTVTLDGEVIAVVPHGSEYTLPVNTKPRNMENIATVTFDYGYDKDPYITYVRKRFNSNGWSINGDAYANNEKITVNEDIVLDREYYETIQGIEFPGTPKRSGYRFNGWYYNDEEITSYNGTEDITITANWIKLIIITYLDDGSTEIVDAGTTKVFEPVSDTEEVFHNITFKYNYEGSPEDKVVRISSHGHYVGWTINGTDEYNDGDEITFNENSTVKARYEDVISNKNLPEDPVREGYDFLGWYDGKNIENSNKVDITKVAKTMTVYGQYKVSGEHVVYFDGTKYTYTDETTVDTESLGFISDTKEDVLTLTLDYQNKSIDNEVVNYTINSTFINWTDEDNNTYGKVIDLTNIPDGMHFKSNYDTEEFTPVDLSTYNPDIDDFLGWYTNKSGGEEVFTYTGDGDATYYAQYDEIKQVIVTIDGEVTIYSVGETFNLPENSIKSNDEIVITFDPQNGEEVFTKSIVTSYTFTGFRLDTDNELYQGETEFTANTDMTFTSEYTSNTTGDTWPSNPEKENYIFLGWYTNQTNGIEVFNFDGITSNTSLYAHYTTDDESFVTLTNTVTGESLKVQKSTDWVFGDSKFNKDNKEKLGTITYKFNSTGYPDEIKDYYRTSTPTGYSIEGDDTLYNIDETHQFTSDTNITPYYGNVETDSHVGIDQFDYEITNGDKQIKCFSKTNQTDPHDDEEYTCYENYDENDGDVTVYLHWKELKKITVTEPNGITKEYESGDIYNTGVNDSTKDSEGYTVTFKYQDGREDTTQSHMTTYTANGWLINGNHVDDNTDITLEEDIVKEYDYSVDTSTITLPEPTRDGYTFKGWNSKSDGKGITYDNDTINSLNKDTIVYGIWTKDEIVVSFNSHGGSDIDDITYAYDEEYGDLPVPTYDENHAFDGWYKEDTYENKVSSKTKATEDIELHAKWIEETFPFVYPVQIEPLVCDGSNYVNTGVMLYDGTNWEKDYEIGFTIDEFDSDANENQAVFANTKYEVESLGWPGLAFRKAAGKLEITQNINGTKKNVTFGDYAPGYKVRIMRIDKTIYYQINDGQVKSLQSMSNFNQQFELPVYFCAGDNGSGGTQRHLKGTISNYYVRRGTYEDLETHTVTYPDGTVETYIHGSVLDLEANESTKASEVVSTVTFKPENGENDIESTVVKNYTPNGFMINGVHYDDESSLVVDEDKVITYSYDEDIDEAIFPDDPEKEHYDFDGWFDGDTEYTEYSGDTDITLTAEYTRRTVTITLPDEPPVVINEGDSYDLSENTEAKSDDNIAEVTFKYHDDETEDLVRYVTKSYTPNGWIIDGVHYDDYASITPTKDITVIPDYIETINGAEFPSNPSRDNYEFMGWFTEETSGEKVTSYDGENDIILHAQWDMTLPTDFDIDSDDVLMVKGETHQIEVAFIPDGTSDTISYTSSDDNIATVSSDGLITAVDKGVITIIVSLDNVDVEKIITVTVVSDKLESETYDVLDKEKEEEPDDRIVIGAEPGTTIQEFKENMLNPVNYIKIYDGDTELSEDDIVKTGLTIKLEINGIVHDEAIIIVRGDINEDGLVNVIDKSILSEHILRLNNIEGYKTYAADVDNNDSINITDKSKLSEYILRLIDSLNE